MSFDNCHKSLIDHIIVSQELSCYIKYCKILDDNSISISSHRPIVFVAIGLTIATMLTETTTTNNIYVVGFEKSVDNLIFIFLTAS